MAATQDGEQNQRADNGNDDRAKTAEAVREESEHPPISSGDTLSVCILLSVRLASSNTARSVACLEQVTGTPRFQFFKNEKLLAKPCHAHFSLKAVATVTPLVSPSSPRTNREKAEKLKY